MRTRSAVLCVACVVVLGAGACGRDASEGGTDGGGGRPPAAPESQGAKNRKDRERDQQQEDVIAVRVRGGNPTVRGDAEVALGEEVTITVRSDTSDHVHVHGYDKLVDVTPGKEATLRFTADIPGVFEVELEDAGTPLFELSVR